MTLPRTPSADTPDLGALDELDLARPRPAARAARRRRVWPWALLVLVAAMLGGAGLFLNQWRQQIGERLVPESAINLQIEQAQQALAQGNLSNTDGSGAREQFQAVLARDPDHLAARSGMAAVRDAALAQARAAIDSGDAVTARARIEMARGMAAPATALTQLEQDLQQIESAGADVADRLDRALAAQARDPFDPSQEGALALYREVLQVQPDNAVALAGRRDILSGLVGQAQQALVRGDLLAAEAMADRIVDADPSHLELPALKARLGEVQQQRQRARDEQMTRAVTALRAGNLTAAADTFMTLLASDPGSIPARQGLDDAAAAMAVRAGREAADFDFVAAQASLQLARQWQPSSPAIAAAERRLAQAQIAQGQLPAADPVRLEGLLERAHEAMRLGDLIEPPGTSAWDFLRQASAMAPGSSDVRAALAQYDRRARACFEDELAGNRLSRAQACLDARAARDTGGSTLALDRRRLADRWLAYADERLGANEVALARRAMASARSLDPEHPGLAAMAERLARAGG